MTELRLEPSDPAETAAARLFIGVGRIAGRLPVFRGRNRVLLALFRALGLHRKHVRVLARLRFPTPFLAKLDLHGWLERIAFLSGGYESDSVRFLLKLYAARGGSGYILDVGANIGLLSIPLALAIGRRDLCVVAVEPVVDNLSVLTTNIALNGLESSVRVIPVGLGDARKAVEIQVEGDLALGEGSGTANVLPEGSTYQCVRQQVEIETVDNLRRTMTIPPGCSVIKIDTDGYDLNVLRGAVKLLTAERPVIFGEFMATCLKWHGQSVLDVREFADSHRYHAWARMSRSWTFSESFADESFVQDLLLVPQELAARFAWCLRHATR